MEKTLAKMSPQSLDTGGFPRPRVEMMFARVRALTLFAIIVIKNNIRVEMMFARVRALTPYVFKLLVRQSFT